MGFMQLEGQIEIMVRMDKGSIGKRFIKAEDRVKERDCLDIIR